MPMDKATYPANWGEVRAAIQQRAGDACEWCKVPNNAFIERVPGSVEFWVYGQFDKQNELVSGNPAEIDTPHIEGVRLTRVVCTTAHLGTVHADGTPGDKHNKLDCRPENLAFLCNRCHLLFDLDDHVRHAAETRRRKRVEAGQLTFLEATL